MGDVDLASPPCSVVHMLVKISALTWEQESGSAKGKWILNPEVYLNTDHIIAIRRHRVIAPEFDSYRWRICISDGVVDGYNTSKVFARFVADKMGVAEMEEPDPNDKTKPNRMVEV